MNAVAGRARSRTWPIPPGGESRLYDAAELVPPPLLEPLQQRAAELGDTPRVAADVLHGDYADLLTNAAAMLAPAFRRHVAGGERQPRAGPGRATKFRYTAPARGAVAQLVRALHS